ncbi:MAG: hypothetical protein WAN43_20365 [Rhodomicrobium sp.]|jgi:hypothetical protein
MKRKIKRTRKLLEVQKKLLLTERQELQNLKDTLAQARQDELDAYSLLNDERSKLMPPHLLVRRAVSSALRIRNFEGLLEAQTEKTLDQARREQLVRKKLDSQYADLSREDWKAALQLIIDAHLSSSQKQD